MNFVQKSELELDELDKKKKNVGSRQEPGRTKLKDREGEQNIISYFGKRRRESGGRKGAQATNPAKPPAKGGRPDEDGSSKRRRTQGIKQNGRASP